MKILRVVVGRTESGPGEYANVRYEVELQAEGTEDAKQLEERATALVEQGLRAQLRRHRARTWYREAPIEGFGEMPA